MTSAEFSEFLDFTRYFYDDDFALVLDEVINMVRTLALTNILPILTAFALVRAVYTYMSKNSGKPGIELGQAMNIVGLIILVTISPELMSGIGKISDGISASFTVTRTASLDEFYKWNTAKEVKDSKGLTEVQTTELYNRLSGDSERDSNIITEYLRELAASDEDGGNIFNSLQDASVELSKIADSIRGMVSNALQTLISSNALFLLGLVKLLVGALIFIFGAIMQVLAPLAFAFEMIFPGKAVKYMAVFLSVKFSFLTFLIIEAIIMGFFALAQSGMASGDSSFSLTYNLVVVATYLVSVICYLLVFWFTSKYVGTGEAGRFLSQSVAGAALVMNQTLRTAQKSLSKGKPSG